MKIVVFIKQVPDNTKLKAGDNGPLRDGVEMILNPYDEYALETALRLKDAAGGDSTVTAITLGAPSAKETVKKAVAAGCDAGYVINEEGFKQADSLSLAKLFSQAAKTWVPDASVFLFGQVSLDDAAGQTGPQFAELMGLPSLTFIKNVELSNNMLQASREADTEVELHELSLPAVLCTIKCDYELRSSNIKGVMKANKTEIPIVGVAEFSVENNLPVTRIEKLWQRPAKSGGVMIQEADPTTAAQKLVEQLHAAKAL